MIDNDMTNILRNFAGAEQGTGEITDAAGKTKVSTAATEKNAMKALLEGLDSAQRSVNQMPSTHKMAKSTATAHPAEKFLVGGEHDEDGFEIDTSGWNAYDEYPGPQDPEDQLDLGQTNEPAIKPGVNVHVGHHRPGASGIEGTVVKVDGADVYIKNAEGKTYKGQLKNTTVQEAVTEELVGGNELRSVKVTYSNGESLSTNMAAGLTDEQIYDYYKIGRRFNLGDGAGGDNVVTVKDVEILEDVQDTYEDTIAKRKTDSDVHKKQSLADIFRSMDETEEDKAAQFKRELHDEIKASQLAKGDNGKFNLAEEPLAEGTTTANLDHMVKDIMRVLNRGKTAMITATKVKGVGSMEGPILDYEIDWKDHYEESIKEDEELTWGDELLEDLKLLLDEAQRPQDVVDGVRSLIQQYEI